MMIVSDTTNGGNRHLPSPWPREGNTANTKLYQSRPLDSNTTGGEATNKKHKVPQETKRQERHYTDPIGAAYQGHYRKVKRRLLLNLRHVTTLLFLTVYALTMETDANMSDASTSSKRPAPLSSLGAAKKRHDSEQSLTAKQTRFTEPEPGETTVSTKINRHMENPFLETLTESMLNVAKTPYETLFGNDAGDSSALHDDLQTILTLAGCWIYDTAIITQEQLKKIKEASSSDPILTIAKWTKLN
jgi:hypothetical protein